LSEPWEINGVIPTYKSLDGRLSGLLPNVPQGSIAAGGVRLYY
jgi:hypothetical protein